MAAVPIVTYTSLFPNAEMPQHGLFVAERLRRLASTGRVFPTVVAPVPWFPSRAAMFGQYGRYARIPAVESWEGVEVQHPRYAMLPGIGMNVQARSLAHSTLGVLLRLQQRGLAAVIDAHYFYPDGVAAAIIGRRLQIPVVITARGSDINVLARNPVPRRLILWAASQAAAVVTVSESLRTELVNLGVPADHVRTLRNGVDLERFSPGDRAAARRTLGLSKFTLLSVGRLVGGKGHGRVVEALRELPDCDLIVAGEGPERAAIEALVARHRLDARVRLTGALPQARLIEYYRAADALVLASASEGMPNVVLEALACGTPVVATNVGGIPEVLAQDVGRIVEGRDGAALVTAIRKLRSRMPERDEVRRYAERFGWDATAGSLLQLLEAVCVDDRGTAAPAGARH